MASDSWAKLRETRKRLEKSWDLDIDWKIYPKGLAEVIYIYYAIQKHLKEWCNCCRVVTR